MTARSTPADIPISHASRSVTAQNYSYMEWYMKQSSDEYPRPDQVFGHTKFTTVEDDVPNEHPVYGEQDMVNSPDHYADAPIECIDAMTHCFGIEEVQVYAKIAAFKYLWRSKYKHGSDAEDLAKAEWYIRFANGNDPRDKS